MSLITYTPLRDYMQHKLVGPNIVEDGGFGEGQGLWQTVGSNTTVQFDARERGVRITSGVSASVPQGGIRREIPTTLGKKYFLSINVLSIDSPMILQVGVSDSSSFSASPGEGYVEITEAGIHSFEWIDSTTNGTTDVVSWIHIYAYSAQVGDQVIISDVWAKENSEASHDPDQVMNVNPSHNTQAGWSLTTGGTASVTWTGIRGQARVNALGGSSFARIFQPIPELRHGVTYAVRHVTDPYLAGGTGFYRIELGFGLGVTRSTSEHGDYTDFIVADLFGLADSQRYVSAFFADISLDLLTLELMPVSETEYTLEFQTDNSGYTQTIASRATQIISIGGAVSTTFTRNDYQYRVTTVPLDEGILPNFREMWASAASGQLMIFDPFGDSKAGGQSKIPVILDTKTYKEKPLGSGFWQISFVLREIT